MEQQQQHQQLAAYRPPRADDIPHPQGRPGPGPQPVDNNFLVFIQNVNVAAPPAPAQPEIVNCGLERSNIRIVNHYDSDKNAIPEYILVKQNEDRLPILCRSLAVEGAKIFGLGLVALITRLKICPRSEKGPIQFVARMTYRAVLAYSMYQMRKPIASMFESVKKFLVPAVAVTETIELVHRRDITVDNRPSESRLVDARTAANRYSVRVTTVDHVTEPIAIVLAKIDARFNTERIHVNVLDVNVAVISSAIQKVTKYNKGSTESVDRRIQRSVDILEIDGMVRGSAMADNFVAQKILLNSSMQMPPSSFV
jgi:hypothetical protein